jgi:hypothetical protein
MPKMPMLDKISERENFARIEIELARIEHGS